MMEYWVHLSSSAAKRYFPDSSGTDFTIPLHKPLELKGWWSCALVQFYHAGPLPPYVHSYMLCVDICKDSFVNDFSLPVLHNFTSSKAQKKPMADNYVSVKEGSVQALRLYIRDGSGRPPTFELGSVECTLHFVHHGSLRR